MWIKGLLQNRISCSLARSWSVNLISQKNLFMFMSRHKNRPFCVGGNSEREIIQKLSVQLRCWDSTASAPVVSCMFVQREAGKDEGRWVESKLDICMSFASLMDSHSSVYSLQNYKENISVSEAVDWHLCPFSCCLLYFYILAAFLVLKFIKFSQ